MNLNLKMRILEKFGSQANFSQAAGTDEPYVSRIVRERKTLSPEQERHWARLLGSKPEKLFTR